MNAFLCHSVPHVRLVHDFIGGKHLQTGPAPRQIHDHALLYVARGSGACTSVQTDTLTPGCLLLVPPYVPHGIQLTHPERIHMLNIHFDPDFRPDSEATSHYLLDPDHPRPPGDQYPELATDRVVLLRPRLPAAYVAAFGRVWRHFPATNVADMLCLRAALLDLLAIVVRERNPDGLPPPDPRLEAARRWLTEQAKPVALHEAATHAQMGRSAFAAAFLAQYGIPPATWHRRHRIEKAKIDLIEGDQPVKAVAQRWGFSSAAHFTRAFAADVGLCPSEWARLTRH
jgi:AraC-like DNA-binding protein